MRTVIIGYGNLARGRGAKRAGKHDPLISGRNPEKAIRRVPAADIVIQLLFAGRDTRAVANRIQPEADCPQAQPCYYKASSRRHGPLAPQWRNRP
jgi:hypothetical protein